MTAFGLFLLFLSVLGAALALLSGPNLEVAVPAALVAVAAATAVGLARIAPTLRHRVASRPTVSGGPPSTLGASHPLLTLRRGFDTGQLGRQTVLASLRALERDLSPTGRTVLSTEEERELLRFPTDRFRHWVEERVRRLEAAT